MDQIGRVFEAGQDPRQGGGRRPVSACPFGLQFGPNEQRDGGESMIEGQNTPDQGSIRAERTVSAQIEPRKNQGRRPSRSRRISQIFLSRKIWAAKWDAFQHPANRRLKKSLQKRIENGQCESSFVAEKDFVKYHLDVIDGA